VTLVANPEITPMISEHSSLDASKVDLSWRRRKRKHLLEETLEPLEPCSQTSLDADLDPARLRLPIGNSQILDA
jgi:hypothetical protein